jgi:hypothetical protein
MRIIQSDLIGHFATSKGNNGAHHTGKRHCIYSLDFQPNGYRLATGGAGTRNEYQLFVFVFTILSFW